MVAYILLDYHNMKQLTDIRWDDKHKETLTWAQGSTDSNAKKPEASQA